MSRGTVDKFIDLKKYHPFNSETLIFIGISYLGGGFKYFVIFIPI